MSSADEAEVLAANQAFYDAFTRRDLPALDALWAKHTEVACIHPGWDALFGREEVMESWHAILRGPSPPTIACRGASARVVGDAGVVVCTEVIGGAELIATNLFVREGGRWRLAHHQSGPVSARRPESKKGPPKPPPKPGMLN